MLQPRGGVGGLGLLLFQRRRGCASSASMRRASARGLGIDRRQRGADQHGAARRRPAHRRAAPPAPAACHAAAVPASPAAGSPPPGHWRSRRQSAHLLRLEPRDLAVQRRSSRAPGFRCAPRCRSASAAAPRPRRPALRFSALALASCGLALCQFGLQALELLRRWTAACASALPGSALDEIDRRFRRAAAAIVGRRRGRGCVTR